MCARTRDAIFGSLTHCTASVVPVQVVAHSSVTADKLYTTCKLCTAVEAVEVEWYAEWYAEWRKLSCTLIEGGVAWEKDFPGEYLYLQTNYFGYSFL